MKPVDLHIYRDLYPESLNDLWDKIADLLQGYHYSHPTAEYAALLIVEWIRVNWGAQIRVSRRLSDPRPVRPMPVDTCTPALIDTPACHGPAAVDRFSQFREQVAAVLKKTGGDIWPTEDVVRLVKLETRGLYIPKVPKLDQLARDREIWLASPGAHNMDELVRSQGLSFVRIYQIRAEYQKRRDKYEQPVLPL